MKLSRLVFETNYETDQQGKWNFTQKNIVGGETIWDKNLINK